MNFNAGLISQRLIEFLSGLSGLPAYSIIMGILLVCGFGVPVPEDITLISAGILVGLKQISLAGALCVSFGGVLAGDAIMFGLGRKYGRKIFNLPVFRRIFTAERVRLAEKKVLENSRFICFTGRFLPGLRAPIFLSAGILGVSPWVFLSLDGLAALISVPVWIFVGIWFGENIDQAFKVAKDMQFVIIGVILVTGMGYFLYSRYRNRKSNPSIPN